MSYTPSHSKRPSGGLRARVGNQRELQLSTWLRAVLSCRAHLHGQRDLERRPASVLAWVTIYWRRNDFDLLQVHHFSLVVSVEPLQLINERWAPESHTHSAHFCTAPCILPSSSVLVSSHCHQLCSMPRESHHMSTCDVELNQNKWVIFLNLFLLPTHLFLQTWLHWWLFCQHLKHGHQHT